MEPYNNSQMSAYSGNDGKYIGRNAGVNASSPEETGLGRFFSEKAAGLEGKVGSHTIGRMVGKILFASAIIVSPVAYPAIAHSAIHTTQEVDGTSLVIKTWEEDVLKSTLRIDHDFYGNPRVCNGRVDIGHGEECSDEEGSTPLPVAQIPPGAPVRLIVEE
jgi:hypothetical protein